MKRLTGKKDNLGGEGECSQEGLIEEMTSSPKDEDSETSEELQTSIAGTQGSMCKDPEGFKSLCI